MASLLSWLFGAFEEEDDRSLTSALSMQDEPEETEEPPKTPLTEVSPENDKNQEDDGSLTSAFSTQDEDEEEKEEPPKTPLTEVSPENDKSQEDDGSLSSALSTQDEDEEEKEEPPKTPLTEVSPENDKSQEESEEKKESPETPLTQKEIRQVEELKEWAQYCSLGSAFIHRLGTVVRSGGLGTVTEESLKQMGVLPKLRSAILAAIAAKLAWRPFKKCRMGREDIELVEDLSRLNKGPWVALRKHDDRELKDFFKAWRRTSEDLSLLRAAFQVWRPKGLLTIMQETFENLGLGISAMLRGMPCCGRDRALELPRSLPRVD